MRTVLPVVLSLMVLTTISCASILPLQEDIIRLPSEHEYVPHSGRVPIVYVRTAPREYWDFALVFDQDEVNGLLLVGRALVASLQEGLGTVFKVTPRAASADVLAMVDLDRFMFAYEPVSDGQTVFHASLDFVLVDDAFRKIDDVHLEAETAVRLPEGRKAKVSAAGNAVAELLSIMEKDLAVHAREGWKAGRYKLF